MNLVSDYSSLLVDFVQQEIATQKIIEGQR